MSVGAMNGEEIRALLRHLESTPNFPRLTGIEWSTVTPGKAVCHLSIRAEHLNGAGAVHGGVHATMMDSAMAVALLAMGHRVSTTQMSVHYVAPVTGERINCTAKYVYSTRRTALAEARIHDEHGTTLAMATASFHIFEKE
ncbi:MAG TPA: PaaI family thioesterase [Longimicrobium sp.]|nr:PaaI family thioesterase [Longimicrobium sp.]